MPNSPTKKTHSWGESWLIHVDADCSLHEARGRAGGASSLHLHAGKHNAFLVVAGSIEIWDRSGLLKRLGPTDAYMAPARQPHRMVFQTDAVLYEFYRAAVPDHTLDLLDIDRLEPGWSPEDRPGQISRCDGSPFLMGNGRCPHCAG